MLLASLALNSFENPHPIDCRSWPRVYPRGLGDFLVKVMEEAKPQPTLRQKVSVNYELSDQEMFSRLKLDDPWLDAGLPKVYQYMRQHPRCKIPDSWVAAFDKLDEELQVHLQHD